MRFTPVEIKKAHAISEHMTKQADGLVKAAFGDVAGNPNTWRPIWPTYGGSTILNSFKQQPSFLGSVGRFAKGFGNAGLTGLAAATVGTGGQPGFTERLAGGGGFRKALGDTYNSAMEQIHLNGSSEQMKAPGQWWSAPGPMDTYRQFGQHVFGGGRAAQMPWQYHP